MAELAEIVTSARNSELAQILLHARATRIRPGRGERESERERERERELY